MSIVKEMQNFSCKKWEKELGADKLFADDFLPLLNETQVQWKHCNLGWNHSGKTLLCRTVWKKKHINM